MEKPVQILQITIGGQEYTGVASFMYQYYRKINQNKVLCDFLFCKQNSMKLVMDDPVFSNSEFYVLNATKSNGAINYIKLGQSFHKILRDKRYDIIHINTMRMGVTFFLTCIAKLMRIKMIIAHSHSVRNVNSFKPTLTNYLRYIIKKFGAFLVRNSCTQMFACSKNAGRVLFGEIGIGKSNFKVLPNAIDVDKFTYNESMRKQVRQNDNLEDATLTICQVGRICLEKNQTFSISVLSEISKISDNVILEIIGSGPDEDKVKKYADDLGVLEKVRFLGSRKDVNQLLQGADALIVPSVFEGLGIVAIEAQAAGLPVYASTAIPEETKITDLISYLDLSDGPKTWAEYILNDVVKHLRRDTHQEIINHGYDITSAAKWLEDFYCRKRV